MEGNMWAILFMNQEQRCVTNKHHQSIKDTGNKNSFIIVPGRGGTTTIVGHPDGDERISQMNE